MYFRDHKTEALRVDGELRLPKSAISEVVARQMLAGGLGHSPAYTGLAVTCVLGADPDAEGNRGSSLAAGSAMAPATSRTSSMPCCLGCSIAPSWMR